MHNNWRENLLFGDWVDLVNSDSCNLLSKLSFLKSFCPFIRQPRFGTSVNNFTASTFNGFIHIFSHHCRRYSDFVEIFHLVFHDRMMVINGVTTTIVNSILSCLHSNARFIRGKSWKISLFPKPVGEIAKTSILLTTCFKQFLCSSRLASTFGKTLSAVFVASSNSAWRDVESVITAVSHFSLWSKTHNAVQLQPSYSEKESPKNSCCSPASLVRVFTHFLRIETLPVDKNTWEDPVPKLLITATCWKKTKKSNNSLKSQFLLQYFILNHP